MEKNFVKVQSSKDIITSISLIILGAALALLPLGGATNVTGICVAITGLILVFTLKNGYKESESGERFVKKEHYYPENMKAELQSAVAANPNTIAQGSGDKGNAIRLKIFYNRQSGKAFVQLFEYVPYKYQPCTDMMEYNLSQIENLIK